MEQVLAEAVVIREIERPAYVSLSRTRAVAGAEGFVEGAEVGQRRRVFGQAVDVQLVSGALAGLMSS